MTPPPPHNLPFFSHAPPPTLEQSFFSGVPLRKLTLSQDFTFYNILFYFPTSCYHAHYEDNSYNICLINHMAMGQARFMFYPVFFFFVVLSVTRPKPLSATLRMTQLMVFIRVKNILKIYEYYTLNSMKKSSLQQGGTIG